MKNIKNNWPTIIPIIFLAFSFSSWPYAFYQVLRWVVCLSTGYLAFEFNQKKEMAWVGIFAVTAIVFNPIAPFYMAKSTWQLLDLVALVLLAFSLYSKKKN